MRNVSRPIDPFARPSRFRMSSRTMSSALVLAAILAMPVKETLAANGFQGTVDSTSGSVNVQNGAGYATVNSQTAVINWTTNGTPSGGVVEFFGNGDTMRFEGSNGNYTVLNRVTPADGTSRIAINGIINSYADLSQNAIGGNVWFYSPQGILVGATGGFNVGGLLLTTLDPVLKGQGNLDSGTLFSLGAPMHQPVAGSTVQITSGAQINALQTGSYVALVAPKIIQGGTVTTNGSAAYVAGEGVDISINQGLFDINFSQGTTDTTAITHSGTTTGSAANGMPGDFRRIYLAAMPKNSAITMLLSGGSLGFDIAGAVDQIGNQIILSAGKNLFVQGNIDTGVDTPVSNGFAGNINIQGGTFTSGITSFATGTTTVSPTSGGVLTLPGLNATSTGAIAINATTTNSAVNISYDTTLNTARFTTVPGQSLTANGVNLTTNNGGTIDIGGNLSIFTGTTGTVPNSTANAITMTGGNIGLTATSGTIHVNGFTQLDTTSMGDSTGTAASNIVAGNVSLSGAGTLNFANGMNALMTADANFGFSAGVTAGSAQGGSFTAASLPANLTIGGAGLFIRSSAYGSEASGGAAGVAGGAASAGAIQLTVAGTANIASIATDSELIGGNSDTGNGGAATLNTITIGATGASAHLTVAGAIAFNASATGGAGNAAGYSGGAASASSPIRVTTNVAGSTLSANSITINTALEGGYGRLAGGAVTNNFTEVDVFGGSLAAGNVTIHSAMTGGGAIGGTGGVVTGGTLGIYSATGGTLTVSGNLDLSQTAVIGNDPTPSSGVQLSPGTTQILGDGTAQISVGGKTVLASTATGFENADPGGVGGAAKGGTVFIGSNGTGTIALGTNAAANDRSVTLAATGQGGAGSSGGTGGVGTGGQITVGAGTGIVDIRTTLSADANGVGGNGDAAGAGGVGKGGNVVLRTVSAGGQTLVGDGASLLAEGYGGNGGYDGIGGEGRGGTVGVNATNGTILINNDAGTIGYLNASTNGTGGSGLIGGAGRGGTLNGGVYLGGTFVNATNGTLTLKDGTSGSLIGMTLTSDGRGGNGQASSSSGPGGAAGMGKGGYSEVAAITSASGAGTITLGAATLTATGAGGAGGNGLANTGGAGGLGFGGGASIVDAQGNILEQGGLNTGGVGFFAQAGNGHLTANGAVVLNVGAQGGIGGSSQSVNGGAGGYAVAGLINAGVVSGNAGGATTGTADFFGTVTLNALGQGGNGATGGTNGGNAGYGQGGSISFLSRGGTLNGTVQSPAAFSIQGSGLGGNGGFAQNGTGGSAGNGLGGSFAIEGSVRSQTTVAANMKLGAVTANVTGLAGSASNNGAVGQSVGGDFRVRTTGGSAVNLASLSIIASGAAQPTVSPIGELSAIGGTLKIAGGTSISSAKNVGLFTDVGGIIETNTLGISAVSIVDSIDSTPGGAAGIVRTLSSSPTFTISGSFTNRSSFVSPSSFTLTAGQQGSIAIGGITAPGTVFLQASNGITVQGDINASAGFTSLASSAGAISTGNISALEGISISSGGAGSFGTLTTENYVNINSAGTVTLAGAAVGRNPSGPQPSFSYPKTVNISAGGNLTATGLISAADYVLLSSTNGSTSVAAITSDKSIGLLAATNVSASGALSSGDTSGGVYIANSSMYASAQQTGPAGLFNQAPVQVGGTISTGAISATKISAAALGAITLGNLTQTSLALLSGGQLTTGDITISDNLSLFGNGGVTTGALNATGFVEVTSSGAVTLGAVTSGDDIDISGGAVTTGALVAKTSINVEASGNLNVASGSAGRIDARVAPSSSGISLTSTGTLTTGALTTSGNIGLLSQGVLTADTLTTDSSAIVLAGGNTTLGTVSTGTTGELYIANQSMFPILNNAQSTAPLFATTPVALVGTLSLAGVTTGKLDAAATGGIGASAAIGSTGDIRLVSGGAITTTALTSGQTITLRGSALTTGQLTAGGAIGATALTGGATVAGATAGITNPSTTVAATARNITINAAQSIDTGALQATNVNLIARGGNVSAGALTSTGNAVLLASNNVAVGAVTAGGLFYVGNAALAGQNLQTTQISPVGGTVTLNGAVSAGTVLVAGNGVTGNGVTSTGPVTIFSATTLALGDVTAAGKIDLGSTGNLTAGALVSGNSVGAESDSGSTSVASASAGLVNRSTASDATYKVGISGSTGVTVGAINAVGDVGMKTDTGSISAGAISTQGNVAALSGGNTTLASVATGSGGTVYLANASMSPLADADNDFNLTPLLAATPVRSTGAVLINGAVTTGTFRAASTGFTAQAAITSSNLVSISSGAGATLAGTVTAPVITIGSTSLNSQTLTATGALTLNASGAATLGGAVSGGAVSLTAAGLTAQALTGSTSITVNSSAGATFNAAVVAPTISVTSSDIALGANGALGGATTTALTLTSNGGATIGGATGATGYQLDGTEIGKLRAAQINLVAAGDIAMQALSLNASTQLGATGGFRVTTPGAIRITGAVDFSNVAAGNTASFTAGRSFTIVTDTGRLRMLDANNALAGTASISATDIAVVNTALATQLAANPRFAGRELLLAAAQTGSGVNADGYLRAGKLNFTASNTLYVQNSGDASAPAGFSVGSGGVSIASTAQGTATPLDAILYGRGVDSAGVALASNAVVGAVTVTPTNSLSTTSTVNSCAFGGATCGTATVVQVVTQTQVSNISATIQAAVTGGLTNPGTPGTTTSGSTSGGGGTQTASNDSGGGSGGGGDDDGGDDSDTTAAAPSSVGNANVLIDTNNIGSPPPQPDAVITSSGNSSLWSGADGIAGDGLGGDIGAPATGGTTGTPPATGTTGAQPTGAAGASDEPKGEQK